MESPEEVGVVALVGVCRGGGGGDDGRWNEGDVPWWVSALGVGGVTQ